MGKCRDLPRLYHLGIACKELEVDPANTLEELPSFDFRFSEATDSTMEQVMACKGCKVSYWPTEDWGYIKVCKAGTIQIKVFAFVSDAKLLAFDEPGLTPLDCLSRSITV